MRSFCHERLFYNFFAIFSEPAAPKKSTFQVDSNLTSLTIKGTTSTVQAITGPLDAYRISYLNNKDYRDDTFQADKNADLEVILNRTIESAEGSCRIYPNSH